MTTGASFDHAFDWPSSRSTVDRIRIRSQIDPQRRHRITLAPLAAKTRAADHHTTQQQQPSMRGPLLLLAVTLLSRSGAAQDHLDPFPNATAGTFFSGVFSSGAVLQRAPRAARLFGVVIGATAESTVTVTVAGAGASYEVVAEVEVTTMKVKAGGLYARWVATLRPHEAGGNVTAAAACAACGTANANSAKLVDLQFGDVWFCSGQVRAKPASQTVS